MSTELLNNGGVQTLIPLQVVYLDFDGADTAYHGEALAIDAVTVQNSGLNDAQISTLTGRLNATYEGSIRFVTERPQSGEYSTVYVGATDAFAYHGLAETIDEGNQNHSDNAFVNLRGGESLETIQQIISHEVDHLTGTLDHGGDGLAAYTYGYNVSSGVTSTGVTLNYDSMYIYNGGTANGTKISGGYMYVYNGGAANSTTMSGGIIYLSGGTVNDTLMPGYGQMYISSGGSANNTLTSSGDIMVFSGGTANSTTLNSGGRIMIYSGGTANNTTINWQGSMLLYGGGTADGVIINSNGQMIAYEQAKANDIIVNSSGTFYVYAESVVNDITVNAGGYLGVEAGGSALNVIWTPCAGTVTVADGAYVTYQSNYSGCYLGSGNLLQSQAATMTGTVISGSMYIANSGVAESAVLNTGGIMTVASGGTASSTAINGGNLTVYSGGSAVNVIWTPCVGTVTVNNGAYVSYQSSYSGCYLGSGNLLQSQAATMSGKTVTGAMYIFSGGTANSAYTNSQGIIYISSGGVANSTTMDRGYMYIYQGGSASRTTLNYYGQMFISSGGMANSTTINDAGWMYLLSGGSASNTAINSGGRMYISSGGTANSTTFNFGFGSGKIYVLNGAVASNTTVSNGGSMFIASGGSAVNVQWTPFAGTLTVADGGYVSYQNSLSGCYLGSGNTLQSQAATMSGKVVAGAGSMYVANGGTANSTTISGSMFILSGGVANSTVLNSGQMYISSGGTANSTTVSSGGSLFVRAGGSAVANVINMSGALFVNSGGTAETTTVSRGSMFVNSGAAANNNTLKNYGSMIVSSGGITSNNTVSSNCRVFISSGGKITGNLTIAGGAVVSAYAGAEVNFDVSKRSVDDGYLINDLSLVNGAPNYTITVSATQSTGIYKLAQGADGFTQTISIGNGASTLGSLSANGAAVKYGDYEYSLLLDSGNLSLSVSGSSGDKVNPAITDIKASTTDPTNGDITLCAVYSDDKALASSLYKIGSGEWTTYTGAITVSGNATVYFKAVDTAGNEATAQYEVTNIDKVNPTITGVKASETAPTNQNVWVSAVFDDDRALILSQYKIGDGDWTNYSGAVNVASNAIVYFKAVDTAGNEATAQYEVKNILNLDPQAPGTVVPTARVNKYDATISWSAPAAQNKAKIIGYEVSINGEISIIKGTSLTLKAMQISVGNTVQVRALDSLGRYGALSDIITFDIKDVTAPVLGKVTTALDQYTATVNWSGIDNVGIDHYQVKCGDQTQTLPGTSAVFANLAIGVNNVQVIAFDAAGNAGKAVTAKITVKDITAPDPVTGLANPTVDSKYKATLSWSAAVDNSGSVASYEIQLDDGKILKSTKTSLAVSNLAVGQHSYQVRAIDKAKNVGEWSAAMAFTVLDTTAPGTVSAKAIVAQNSITLSWKAPADNVGVTGYQVWVGASPSTMTMEQALPADQLSCLLTNMPKGIYYMDVRAIDAASNVSASKPVKITVTSSLPVNIALSSSSLDLLKWSSPDAMQQKLA